MSGSYESSEEDEAGDVKIAELVQSVFRSYSGDAKSLQKTQHSLENQFQADAATCLICIARVRRNQPIWSCEHCFCFLHLACIQRWANDSIWQKQMNHENEAGYYTQGVYVPKKVLVLNWHCPQCRKDYPKADIPTRYTCFCGKEEDPEPSPWTIPHSCGEICGKALKPNCGHKCVLLCHPGACPPCPQMIAKGCDCGQSALKTIRCSTQSWQCGKVCQKTLACGNHKCSAICHKACKPCPKRATRPCLCGKTQSERDCSEASWKCEKECHGRFLCGKHDCNRGCHDGPCGPCNQPTTCPCGKEQSSGDCLSQVDSCGDTCLKVLDCGEHKCLDRCHKGSCSKCKEIVAKSCFCGLQTREVGCIKPFRCETKCKKLRNCKLHLCNRKCCDGQCPPCDKVCDKPLACTKHKCKSMCHTGPCYPCNLKASLKCRCAGTVIEVQCGRARKTKPPKCQLPCKKASSCHHENLHHCHEGDDCPICGKICNLPNDTTLCEHPCQARCHAAVLTRTVDKKWKPAGPWDVRPEVVEILKLPHPKCEQKVTTPCLGGHDTIQLPCWDSKPRTCGRPCGRQLRCGNHLCSITCHTVSDLKSIEAVEAECMKCETQCSFVRPTGCDHPCRKPCHPPPCSSCTAIIKCQCHCGLVQKMYKCNDAFCEGSTTAENEERKSRLMSCGNRCIKLYPCGHRCSENCHTGECPNPEQCRKKVKVACVCKMRKAEVSCEKLRQGSFVLPCDESCSTKATARQQQEEAMRKEREAALEEQNRVEMEEFQRKYGTKKPKERKQRQTSVEEGRNWTKFALIAAAVLVPVLGTLSYFLFAND